MTTERDTSTRIVLSWLREDAHENAEHALLRALDEDVDARIAQRVARGCRPWRQRRIAGLLDQLVVDIERQLNLSARGFGLRGLGRGERNQCDERDERDREQGSESGSPLHDQVSMGSDRSRSLAA